VASHNDLGKHGELLAVDFLQKAGYEILETNWVFRKAEIDIIALKGNVLAIVEVKTRSSIAFGLPQEFVTPKKIRLLLMAINAYVDQHNCGYEVRLDIIAINKKNNIFEVEHITDAYYHF
jgi:putative endonuclease